jgi:hypothetical protein
MKHKETKSIVNVRILASVAILAGAVVLGNWPETKAAMSPKNIRTVGQALSDCDSRSLQTKFGRLGCANTKGVRGSGNIKIISVGN